MTHPAMVDSQVIDIIARMAKIAGSSIDTSKSVTEYGVDSLALLELREMLERAFHVYFPDDIWISFHSIEDIIIYVDGRHSTDRVHPEAATEPRRVRVGGRRLTPSGIFYDDVEIGMPLTGLNNLAEAPLLKHLGDLRWSHLSRLSGVPSKLLVDADGHRLYPTFFYVEIAFPEHRPMSSYGENDQLRIASTLRRFGTSMLDGECYLLPIDVPEKDKLPFNSAVESVAQGVPAVRLSNIFVRQFSGAEWLKRSRPANEGFERIPEMPVSPDSFAAVKQAEKDGSFSLPDSTYRSITEGAVDIEYQLVADRDLNGAGLVYFANYPLFLDICEREALRAAKLPLAEDLIDRRTLVRRKSAYLNNASSRDTLGVCIEAWVQDPVASGHPAPEAAPIRLFVNYRMYRRSDGRLMMVSTAEKIISGKSMEDASFFSSLMGLHGQ